MEQKYFNDRQLAFLSTEDKNFNSAVNGNYILGTNIAFTKEATSMYEELTGEQLKHNWSCGSCMLKNYKIIGKLYLDSLKNYKKIENLE